MPNVGGYFERVEAQGVAEHDRQESDWGSKTFHGGLVFVFFVGPGEEHGRRRRRCPLRERLRAKEKIIAYRKSTCSKRHVLLFFIFCFVLQIRGLVPFLGEYFGWYYGATCVEAKYIYGR